MKFLDSQHFWTIFWAVSFFTVLVWVVVWDFTAVIKGHHDGVGDNFTLTHWLVTSIGISLIGAFIGYLIAHFLFVHLRG